MEEEEINRRSSFNFHKCNSCAFRTKSLRVMLSHNKHEEESKLYRFSCQSANLEAFECQYCYFENDLKIAVDRHEILVHGSHCPNPKIESMNYLCEKCGFESYSLLVFARHVCSNFKEKSSVVEWFKCEHCSYKGKSKKSLQRHVSRTHFDPYEVKWFKCTQCSYKTARNDHLKRHIFRKHTSDNSDKSLECEHCSYKGKSKKNLRMHVLRRHFDLDKVKWFQCTHCSYKTPRKDYLESHIFRKHSSEARTDELFKCEHCFYENKSKKWLQRHVLQRHFDPNRVE